VIVAIFTIDVRDTDAARRNDGVSRAGNAIIVRADDVSTSSISRMGIPE
jgi:hypothetical protein